MLKKLSLLVFAGLCLCVGAQAQDNQETTDSTSNDIDAKTFLGMSLIDSQPRQQVWIDSGFETYHFDRHADLNGNNAGLGVEYRYSSVSALTAGRFYNSNRDYSDYAGVYYQPIRLGLVQLGAVIGGFNGYPNTRNGGWFLAAIPTATAEWHRVGLNVAFVPSIKNRLYGGISVQLKIKVWD